MEGEQQEQPKKTGKEFLTAFFDDVIRLHGIPVDVLLRIEPGKDGGQNIIRLLAASADHQAMQFIIGGAAQQQPAPDYVG